MNSGNFWIYVLVMFGVTYFVRVVPMLIFREKIKNRFVRSFLEYIPYTVLGAMTFPAVFYATGSILPAAAGVLAAVLLAYSGKGLSIVAISASAVVYLVDVVMHGF